MSRLKAGFARVNITPMTDIAVIGYFKPRFASGVLDELEINALALEKDGYRILMIVCDLCLIDNASCDRLRRTVSEKTGVPFEAVFLSCTHTHTAPYTSPCTEGNEDEEGHVFEPAYIQRLLDEYMSMFTHRLTDAACFALEDLKEARFGIGKGTAPGIAFCRRFLMKDGTVRTNPGVGNPDILRPVGDVDEEVNILRFDRKDAETLVLVNFGCHPDVVGGTRISGDWPALFRRTFEKTVDNTRCLFFNGCQGDINHVNVFPKGGDLNDMFQDFDGVSRGYGHARHMGRVLAGAVLQVYDKVEYQEADCLQAVQKEIRLPSQLPSGLDDIDPETAHRYVKLHEEGRDAEIPYQAMMLTTIVAEALRICRLEHGPAEFSMRLTALRIGDAAFLGIPGEPFTGTGRRIKKAAGWKLVCPCCLTGGSMGYFPMKDCYEEGGYETRSSDFAAGTAELITEEGVRLLDSLRR